MARIRNNNQINDENHDDDDSGSDEESSVDNGSEINEESSDDNDSESNEEDIDDDDNETDDNETVSVEDPHEIFPVIEESNNGESDKQVTSLIRRNDKLLEVMYTEVFSNDVYSLIRKYFKHESMKNLKRHNGDLIRNWIITRTARVTLYHCLAFVLTKVWRVLSVLNRCNLRRLLDLMHSVAHYYRNKRTIKRVFEPGKK